MKTNIFPVFPPRSTAPTHPFQPYSIRSQFGIPAFEAWWLCPVVGPRCAVQQSSTIPAALHIHLPLFALLQMIVTGKAKRFKVITCNLFQPLSVLGFCCWIRTCALQNKDQCVRLQVYKKHDCILQMLLSLFTKGSRVSGEQPRQGWTSRFGNWYASSVDTC